MVLTTPPLTYKLHNVKEISNHVACYQMNPIELRFFAESCSSGTYSHDCGGITEPTARSWRLSGIGCVQHEHMTWVWVTEQTYVGGVGRWTTATLADADVPGTASDNIRHTFYAWLLADWSQHSNAATSVVGFTFKLQLCALWRESHVYLVHCEHCVFVLFVDDFPTLEHTFCKHLKTFLFAVYWYTFSALEVLRRCAI